MWQCSGCGSVVISDIRYPQFEYSHPQNVVYHQINCIEYVFKRGKYRKMTKETAHLKNLNVALPR